MKTNTRMNAQGHADTEGRNGGGTVAGEVPIAVTNINRWPNTRSHRHSVGKKNLILLGMILAAEVALLSFNARLDRFAWRATRWLMGNQNPYRWQAVRLNPVRHPNAPWWRTLTPPMHSRLYHRTESEWRVLRDVGEPGEVLFICVFIWFYDPAGWKAAALTLGGVLGAGAVSELVKAIAGRIRPIGILPNGDLNGSLQAGHVYNVWQWGRGFFTQTDLSFPSGHAMVAFALAAALTYLSPKGRRLFLVVAWLVAFSRVVMQAHFYSDVLAGGAIGWFCGFGVVIWLGRRLGVPQRQLAPADETARVG